jgi:hypothetical protein
MSIKSEEYIMITIKNALLYIKNHQEISHEMLDMALQQQLGVSRVARSNKAKGLIFIDYQPESTSLSDIYRSLGRQGVQSRIIAM